MTHIVTGMRAPDFSLPGLDGKKHSLSSLIVGGPAVVAFFKVSCPVCQFTFPFLQRLYERFGGDTVSFVGISQDDAQAAKKFSKQFGVTFPMLMDEKGYPASNAYGLVTVPTIFLVDTDGTVKISSEGFVKNDLEAIARELADRRKIPSVPLFRPDEKVPAIKPG
ncbi:MAG TPA: TlpA disulfide reductase family protein [Candidatus Dormibacteraeota bacterium]|nr:TlpA disulfide reductase family protein [Candidatus Dormibacteraeota bacterium]